MTVEQTKVIDWVGIEKGTGRILLTIADDLDWSDEHQHMYVLQEKLNSYIAFVESKEVYERAPEILGETVASDTPIEVRVLAKYPPPTEHAMRFLKHAESVLRGVGVTFVYKVVGNEPKN